MAVIGYIRKHSAIAVILVGISLAAFLVGPNLIDWFQNVLGYNTGPGSKREVGIVNGESISLIEFENLSNKNVELQKINQQKSDLSSEDIYVIKDQTWQQRVREILMQNEYEELGMKVTVNEMDDQLMGPDPHPLIRQYFVNENGQYDPLLVRQYMQNLSRMTPNDRAQWENFKEFIYLDRLNNKYNNLIIKSFFLPEKLAEVEYRNNADIIEARYVAPKYTETDDNLVPESTEKQYREYYEENKHRHTQNASRDIEFVVFNIVPSDEDLLAIEKEAHDIFRDWTYANDPGRFVNNIPGNHYDSVWYGRGALSLFIDSVMFAADIGVFIEPYKEGPAWHMARLMDRQMRPDSASAEHILIAYSEAFRANPNLTRTREEAMALADSIYQIIRINPAKLPELSLSLSDDGSAANNSGNLGWFQDGEMVYSFNEAAIKGKKGDIVMIESPFGYHVIHVTGLAKPTMKVRVAQIEVPIEFSSETHDEYYRIAARFAGENTTKEKFDQAVIDQGLEKREATFLREMQLDLPTFTNTRQIIRWVYWDDRKVGDVSPLFDTGKQLFVVIYNGSREDGVVPYNDLKDRLVNNLKNERKADYIISRIEEMGTYDLSAIAEAFNISVDTLTGFSFNSRNIPGYGTEHEVIGKLFTYEEGENTGPIKGNAGVFVAEIDHKYEAPELGSYDAYVNQKRTDFEQRVQNNFAYKAIENTASIKDFRKYYY